MPADPTTLNAFALSCALLAVNLNILWFSSANARLRTGTVASPEDAGLFVKGSVFPPSEPEAVARILRAHSNAIATTVPFVMVAGSYVAVGGASAWAPVLFGTLSSPASPTPSPTCGHFSRGGRSRSRSGWWRR